MKKMKFNTFLFHLELFLRLWEKGKIRNQIKDQHQNVCTD